MFLVAPLEFRLPLGSDIAHMQVVTNRIVYLIIQVSVDDEKDVSSRTYKGKQLVSSIARTSVDDLTI